MTTNQKIMKKRFKVDAKEHSEICIRNKKFTAMCFYLDEVKLEEWLTFLDVVTIGGSMHVMFDYEDIEKVEVD